MQKIAVLGGDARHVEAARVLAAEGFDVWMYGVALPGQGSGLTVAVGSGRLIQAESVTEALAGATLALGPVQGGTPGGGIWTKPGVSLVNLNITDLAGMAPGAPLLIGIGTPLLRQICEAAGVELIEYREDDDFALLNAIPSAEGAIAMAMEMTPYTLFGSICYIIGFGRTGEILALRLKALGADTVVATRKPAALAQAQAHGHRVIPFSRLAEHLGEAQIVFNTAPSLVLFGETLAAMRPGSVIIDLASAPGGVDFEAAKAKGIEAVLAPGLPGKVAPLSAGRYVAQVARRTLNSRPAAGR